MGKNGSNLKASGAFHIHKEGIGRLNQALELVLRLLEVFRRMQQVVIGRHEEKRKERGNRERNREMMKKK